MARSVDSIERLISDLNDLLNNDLYLGSLTTASVTETVCFDCNLWLYGYKDSEGNFIIKPIRTSVLKIFTKIKTQLNKILENDSISDYGFKTQIQRFLDIINSLINVMSSLQCSPNVCDSNAVPELLTALIITISQIAMILQYLNGLLSYYDYCNCMGASLFSLLMGKFINAITELLSYLPHWNQLVILFFQLSSLVPKSYVASYIPKQPIQIPPFTIPNCHVCVPCPPPQTPPVIPKQPSCNCSVTFPC